MSTRETFLMFAVRQRDMKAIKKLLTLGNEYVGVKNVNKHTAFHIAIDYAVGNLDGGETARVLLANGMRLSTLREGLRGRITPELEKFERGVLHCRTAVVAMLRLKKAAKLWHMDRFVLREIGFAIWATRYDGKWMN